MAENSAYYTKHNFNSCILLLHKNNIFTIMLNICGQCLHTAGCMWCKECSGNPKLVDNFKQKPPPPLKNTVIKNGTHKFGSNLNRHGKGRKR